MFQFNYKVKVSERVKANAIGTRATTRNGRDEEASRVDARLASLFSTSIKRGCRSTPRTGSF